MYIGLITATSTAIQNPMHTRDLLNAQITLQVFYPNKTLKVIGRTAVFEI